MNLLPLKLCVGLCGCIALYQTALADPGPGDALPLGKKTQGSLVNPDVIDVQDPRADQGQDPRPRKAPPEKSDTLGLKERSKPRDETKSATATPTGPVVGPIDIYGTDRVTTEDLKELFGADLDTWIELGKKNDPKSLELQSKLAKRAKEKWGFAFAEWSMMQFVTPEGPTVQLTLDVVEKKDAERRMHFLPEPTGTFVDPDDLIKQWFTYEGIAFKLMEQGKLAPDTEKCVALHCPFGHKLRDLKPFEKIFVQGVKKHYKTLFSILKNDARPQMRAGAAFLLAYYKNAKEVVSAMADQIPDSDMIVRNNVLRVLGHVAQFHPDIPVPLAPVLKALEYPRVSDRSKSVIIVFQMADHTESARDLIRRTSIPVLLQMLMCRQPDQREISHAILRKVSGRDFAVDDEKSWRQWAQSLSKDQSISHK